MVLETSEVTEMGTKATNDGDNRGENKKATTGTGKTSPYARSDNGRICDWGSVDSEVLAYCVDVVTRNGDALLLGRSMDGGVLVLTICAGTERIKFYAREGLEMSAHMQGISNQLDIRSGRI